MHFWASQEYCRESKDVTCSCFYGINIITVVLQKWTETLQTLKLGRWMTDCYLTSERGEELLAHICTVIISTQCINVTFGQKDVEVQIHVDYRHFVEETQTLLDTGLV